MNNRKYLLILGLISTAYIPNAKADLVQCLACSAGTYGKNGKCIKCEEGYYSDNTASTSCKKCNAGTYSNSGDTSCTDCPTGYKCPDGKKIQCEEGTVSKTTGGKRCSACKDREYAIKDRTYCGNKWIEYKSYKTAGTYTETLPAGIYMISMSGGGGGGGGGATCTWGTGRGGEGGHGEHVYKDIVSTYSISLSITIGKGGDAGSGGSKCKTGNDGKDGQASIIKTNNNNTIPIRNGSTITNVSSISVTGGGGGKKAYVDSNATGHSGSKGTEGTSLGSDGGEGGWATGNGESGSDGYVIIYKADDNCYSKPNGTGCTSSTSTGGYYGGGCS